MRTRMFFRALGRFLGTVITGVFQGTIALIGDGHRRLHREFGQRVWVFYTLGALIVWLYATGGLMPFVAQLFAIVQQLVIIGILIFAMGIMIRGVTGRR